MLFFFVFLLLVYLTSLQERIQHLRGNFVIFKEVSYNPPKYSDVLLHYNTFPGPGCSKLTTSLVNDTLKFTSTDMQIC